MAGIEDRIGRLEAAAQLERARASREERRWEPGVEYLAALFYHLRTSAESTGEPLVEVLVGIGVPPEDAQRFTRLYYAPQSLEARRHP